MLITKWSQLTPNSELFLLDGIVPYVSKRLWPFDHHQVLKGRWRELSCSYPLLCEDILDSSHITKLCNLKGC